MQREGPQRAIAGFEEKEGPPPAQDCGQPVETQTARKHALPKSLQSETSPVDLLIIAQGELFWTSAEM